MAVFNIQQPPLTEEQQKEFNKAWEALVTAESAIEVTHHTPIQHEAVIDGIHQFSRKHARQWGVSDAIVLGYMASRVRTSKNVREGRKWFYNTLDEVHAKLPYIGRSTLDDILNRLKAKGLIEIRNFNRYKQDRTRWFTMSSEVMDQAAEDPIYFRRTFAAEHGVCAAVILYNLEKNVQRQHNPDDIFHRMVPATLAELLPYSISTIERTLKQLRDSGVIVQAMPNSSSYSLKCLFKSTPSNPDEVSVNFQETPSNPDMGPSNPDETPSFPDETPSNPDNVTHYKPLQPLERPFKTPQTSSDGFLNSLSSDQPKDETLQTDKFLPHFCSYEQLRNNCRKYSGSFPTKDHENVKFAIKGCESFLCTLTTDEIYNLVSLADKDLITQAIEPDWNKFFNKTFPQIATDVEKSAFHAICMDILVIALFTSSFGSLQQTALVTCIAAAYNLCLQIDDVYDPEAERQLQLRFKQHSDDCKSPDHDKEELSNLAPAEKARILRNAVQGRNDRGWLFEGEGWIYPELTWSHAAKELAQTFFQKNADCTVGSILGYLDAVVDIISTRHSTKGDWSDPYKRTRRCLDIAYFFNNISAVLIEMGISNDLVPLYEPQEIAA